MKTEKLWDVHVAYSTAKPAALTGGLPFRQIAAKRDAIWRTTAGRIADVALKGYGIG